MTNNAKSTGSTPVIVFRNHADRTLELHYAPANNYTDPNDDVYDFVASQGDMQIWNYLNEKGSYIYSPPAPPPKPQRPDLQGFSKALRAEPSFTPAIRIGLAMLLNENGAMSADPAALQQYWQDLISVNGTTWLTSDVQTKVTGYAAKFNLPLVAV